MGYAAADKAAEAVADVYGWDAARTKQEADEYRRYLQRMHAVRPSRPNATTSSSASPPSRRPSMWPR